LADVKSPKVSTESKDKASTLLHVHKPNSQNELPTVMITGIENHEAMSSIINQAIGDEHYQIKLMSNGITKVNVSSDYTYRILTNSLKINNVPWFSYENKQIRVIKVMIKNLHHSFQPVNILHGLNDQDFQALNATPKLKWKTKEPIDMLFNLIEIQA
jgi:hypothetical protein